MNSELFAGSTFSTVCVLWNPIKSVLYKTSLVCLPCAGRLFASKGLLIPLAATYLFWLMQVVSADQLVRTQSSHSQIA